MKKIYLALILFIFPINSFAITLLDLAQELFLNLNFLPQVILSLTNWDYPKKENRLSVWNLTPNQLSNFLKNNVYEVQYAPNSPLKNIPLKNAQLLVKLYYHGNPRGLLNVKTDEFQELAIFNKEYRNNRGVALEILAITHQELYNANCFGEVANRNSNIQLVCKKAR